MRFMALNKNNNNSIPVYHNDNDTLNTSMLTSEIINTFRNANHNASIDDTDGCIMVNSDYENGVVRIYFAHNTNNADDNEIHVILEYIQYDDNVCIVDYTDGKPLRTYYIPCDYSGFRVFRKEYYIADSDVDIYDCISEITLILSCLNVFDESLSIMNDDDIEFRYDKTNGRVLVSSSNAGKEHDVYYMDSVDYRAMKYMYETYKSKIRTDYKPINTCEL